MNKITQDFLNRMSLDEIETEILRLRRRTGRSLGNAFEIIGKAMSNPEVPVKIWDHVQQDFGPENVSNHTLEMTVIPHLWKIIESFNLERFVINKAELTITYNLPVWYHELKQIIELNKNVSAD